MSINTKKQKALPIALRNEDKNLMTTKTSLKSCNNLKCDPYTRGFHHYGEFDCGQYSSNFEDVFSLLVGQR